MERREFLKRTTAVGAAAWTAPFITAAGPAPELTCTPGCLPPEGTPQFTASAQGACGAFYTVTVTPALVPGSVTCPCGGDAVIVSPALVRRFPRRFRGSATLSGDVTVACPGGTGEECTITCTLTVTVVITGNPGNDCAQSAVSVTGVSATCPAEAAAFVS